MIRPGSDIRAEAAELARLVADGRQKDGDPEGAAVIRDLAMSISKIKLTEPRR